MEIAAWALQILLAIVFTVHSWVLLAARPDQIRTGSEWILEIPQTLRRFAGAADGLRSSARTQAPDRADVRSLDASVVEVAREARGTGIVDVLGPHRATVVDSTE